MLRSLQSLVPDMNALETELERLDDEELKHRTVLFRERLDRGETLDDLLVEAFAVVREASAPGHRAAALRRAADGRRGAALRLGGRDEDGRGQDPRLDAARLPERVVGQRAARGHGERVPGPPRRRVDGPDPQLAGPQRRAHRARHGRPRPQAPAVRGGRHLRHQQRVRLRLPARQHGDVPPGPGAAGPRLLHRRRDRLDPGRRGPHAAHHLRSGVRRGGALQAVRPRRPQAPPGRRLRGRRREAPGRGAPTPASRRSRPSSASRTSTTSCRPTWSTSSTWPSRPRSCSTGTRTTSSSTAR